MENLLLERKILSSKDFSRLKDISLIVDRTIIKDTAQNRQSHSIEVANTIEIMNAMISEKLGFNIDPKRLGRSIGLLHDIGHMAKGHVGERTLNEYILKYSNKEIFYDSNSNNYIKLNKNKLFEGISLSTKRYVLASLAKHENSLYEEVSYIKKYIDIETKKELKYLKKHMKIEKLRKTIQCQVMDIADEISYIISDIVDSANILSKKQMKEIFKRELPFEVYLKLSKTIGNKSNFRKELDYLYFQFCDNFTINKEGIVSFINKDIEEIRISLARISKKYLLKNELILEIRAKEVIALKYVFDFYFNNLSKNKNIIIPSKYYAKKFKFAKTKKEKILILRDFLAGITDKGLEKEIEKIK
jgi:dGTP triphosphohydrolase